MSEPAVLIARDGATARLTLNRPERGNALGAELVEALHRALDDSLAAGARLIVLDGAGRHTCTGFDLDGLEAQSEGDLLLRFVRIEELLQKVAGAPAVTLAVGRGRTTGAGADLFAACDIRIALDGTGFAFPGAGFGIVLGSRRLAARVGATAAQGLIFDGRSIAADEAGALGLATAVAPEDGVAGLIAAAAARAERMDVETLLAARDATAPPRHDADLAALVRSASRPGLKDRIAAHRERVRAARPART